MLKRPQLTAACRHHLLPHILLFSKFCDLSGHGGAGYTSLPEEI